MAKKEPEIPLALNEEENPEEGKSSLKKWLILGALVFALLATGVGAAAFFLPEYMPAPLNFFEPKSTKGSQDQAKPPQEERGHIYAMDPFIVNLADAEQNRYLKIRINLESRKSEADEEFTKKDAVDQGYHPDHFIPKKE